jgi:Transposase DDE domain group 1
MWLVEESQVPRRKASVVRVCHGLSVVFDDPNLVSCAGLVPIIKLAERAGLHRLVGERLRVDAEGGANPVVKVTSLVAGMVAGADSIDDMDLLRHGGMGRVFDQTRAPSTLGTFLRAFTFGHVRQLDAVASRLLAGLAGHTPLLPGADQIAYLDVDDTVRETHGYAKQGAGYGYTGVRGLNALLATVSTPLAAPVIAACRLRKGSVNSARGAERLIAEAAGTARSAGASGLLVARLDSAFYNHQVIRACQRHGVRFSVTARLNRSVLTAIGGIDERAWTTIKYPDAVWDEDEQRWISEAEVAEVPYPAFGSRRKADQVTAWLIVRRVRRLNPDTAQGRTVRRLPIPPGVHGFAAAHAGRRGRASRPCRNRAGHRRPEGKRPGPPALRPVLGQQCVAGAGRGRVQPHPRRRRPGLDLPRPSDHRHHPRPPDRSTRTDRPTRPATGAAPTLRLALATRLAATVRDRGARSTTGHLTPCSPARKGPTGDTSGRAGQTGSLPTPQTTKTITNPNQPTSESATVDPGSMKRGGRGTP